MSWRRVLVEATRNSMGGDPASFLANAKHLTYYQLRMLAADDKELGGAAKGLDMVEVRSLQSSKAKQKERFVEWQLDQGDK